MSRSLRAGKPEKIENELTGVVYRQILVVDVFTVNKTIANALDVLEHRDLSLRIRSIEVSLHEREPSHGAFQVYWICRRRCRQHGLIRQKHAMQQDLKTCPCGDKPAQPIAQGVRCFGRQSKDRAHLLRGDGRDDCFHVGELRSRQ